MLLIQLTSDYDAERIMGDSKIINTQCDKYGLVMKPVAHSIALDPSVIDTPADLYQDSFGLMQDLVTSTQIPCTTLSLQAAKRGVAGPRIETVDVWVVTFRTTKREIQRVVSSLYDLCGIILGPLIANGKILASEAHSTSGTGEQSWDVPIITYNEALDTKIRHFYDGVKGLTQKIRPFQNYVIPPGYTPVRLIIYRDGALASASSVAYVVSKKNEDAAHDGPAFFSYILMARNVTQTRHVPFQSKKLQVSASVPKC